MSKYPNLGAFVLKQLSDVFPVTKEEIGKDARLKKGPITLNTETYSVSGAGHLCCLKMNALFGLMKMETVVLACTEKDVPLLNLDWVGVFGKETQIVELYRTQLAAYPEDALNAFLELKKRDLDLPEPKEQSAHWYDDLLYPCSYHKAGKGIGGRTYATAQAYITTFVAQMKSAPNCDKTAKQERISAFAQMLFTKGGPAVDTITRLFGPETAERLILRRMYGV